ncbi:type II toxin-antitoxin system HipA family toxin YjjJ [Archangium primigenium]|uniref:type II toxin-antitoxin system HipA family toxin YjjJ n=1 Tax=[Archangium] primigenium TaxID=2792470 RepID=UPI00195C519C|nr:type II toxin-antitoxin system HipA family toxin YjjJ [Archangium primigenium]MBM7112546.1 type II toxin-antitoxin system HipA family toxin YjjJ [Archangium primigenium]
MQRLLTQLVRQGHATARELAEALGVSQPTLSRLVQEAGPRVLRMGRARSTRYAATRTVPGLGTSLPLHRIDETGTCQPAGRLHFLSGGRHWDEATDTLFEGLPPFAADMRPQGYVGRTFSARFPELALPPRLADWREDEALIALARRGEDCVGDLLLGEESLDRWFQREPVSVPPSDYPDWALRSDTEQVGSSAGGEHPKFLTYSEGRHVLVKFASHDTGEVARRWRELLVCECLALDTLRQAGLDAARARWFDTGPYRFLEVERFDRVGARGRRGLLSLDALDNEYIGAAGPGSHWTALAPRLLELGFIAAEDARRLRWLDVFGQLIANSDRHFGNVSFLVTGPRRFCLAPAYDMLPMTFAPSVTTVVERPFEPAPPTAATLDVWAEAARHASVFWSRVAGEGALGADFRALARRCGEQVEALRARMAPRLGG